MRDTGFLGRDAIGFRVGNRGTAGVVTRVLCPRGMNITKLLALTLSLGAFAACGAEPTSEDTPLVNEDVAETQDELNGATDCRALIRSQMDWLRAGGGNYLTYRMVSHEPTRSQLVGVTDGHFDRVSPGLYLFGRYHPARLTYDASRHNGTTMFSDRRYNRGTSIGYQPFDITRRDEINLSIDESGNVHMVLRTWGNTVVNLEPSECRNGILHAFGGARLYTITFFQGWLG